jgi:hypothetical protein
MKIPEKPLAPSGISPGTVSGSPYVQDSGPMGHKAPVGRVEPPVSEGARELAALVDSGQLTPAQAMELVIDSIVRQAPGADPEGLRSFLVSQVATDPQLRQLAASLGLDARSLEDLASQSEQVKS